MHEATEIDPLIRMAVTHYQFEAIHPFTDGNGRTGRILNSLILIQENLLTLPILYLSRYILNNKAGLLQIVIKCNCYAGLGNMDFVHLERRGRNRLMDDSENCRDQGVS